MKSRPAHPLPLALALLAWLAVAAVRMPVIHAADLHVPSEYPTIQAAVDAAAFADKIQVGAGIYQEQVRIIGKDLTLMGEPGAILRAFPGMQENLSGLSSARSSLFVHLAGEVCVSNLWFEGDQLGDQQGGEFVGCFALDSNTRMVGCRFTGFRERDPGTNDAWAVKFQRGASGPPQLGFSLWDNFIVDCYGGIQVLGEACGRRHYSGALFRNVIRGIGASTSAAELVGVDLRYLQAGDAYNNTISNFNRSGDLDGANRGYGLRAILCTSLDWDFWIVGNAFTDNSVHLRVDGAGRADRIQQNRFEQSSESPGSVGLWIGGDRAAIDRNAFKNLSEGIRLGGVPLDSDEGPGVASGLLLEENRFTDVATPVHYGSGATARVRDTLIAPFREPELTVTKAIGLSWPDYHDDYVLERSGGFGPWTPVDPAEYRSTTVGVPYEIFFPSDTPTQFFRLRRR